jgi:gliding motility-associated protein GldL
MKKNTSAFSRFQDFLETEKGQTILNYLYSWGAAIVILGALFKLTHINGANLMLFLGMGTEVLTFIINGFERQSSVKEVENPTTAGGPVIIGGAPVVSGTVVSTPMADVMPVVETSETASQFDADTLATMANIAAANAAVAAANATPVAAPQIDPETLTAIANIAAANTNVASTIPIIEGDIDVPELQQVTQDYVDKLRSLTESFQHIADQSAQLEASADEVERLSRNLTSINTIYEMHLKSLGSQIGNIDMVNDQTRRMAEQIEELNRVYDRMLQSMTVNMNVGRSANEQSR